MDTHQSPTDRPDSTRGRGQRRPRALPLRIARDLLTVRRVFGEPIQQGDVTIVPVARVMGGSCYCECDGMCRRSTEREQAGAGAGSGSGGGLGVRVTPVGVYLVRGSDVQWQPAFDLNRVVLGGQVFATIALLVLSRALRRRRRR